MMGRLIGWSACAIAASVFLIAGDAQAIRIDAANGELTGSFDTTISLGVSQRTAEPDPDLIGVVNGGTAFSINGDNGNLNYNKWRLTSAVARVTHELDLRWKSLSFFGRGFYFYDSAIVDGKTYRTGISRRAIEELGRVARLLDAYAAVDLTLGNTYLNVRGGNQVLSWGESTFIQNGINTVSAVDVSKLRVAGAELRQGLTAIPTLSASWSLNEYLSVEGFYQLYFDHTEIEPEGTFFSTSDFASPGGFWVFLGFGLPPVGDNPPVADANPPVGSGVQRQADRDARDDGQFGVALRWFAPQLNDTEFGFYYTRLHSRLPLISALTGTAQGLGDGNYALTARHFREFPEDINTVGVSFNTEIGNTGTALQGELAYRDNQPLQIDDVELLFAALTPVLPPVFGQNQIGVFGFGEEIRGWREQKMMQFQSTVTQNFGPQLGANQFVALGEIGVTHFPDLEDKDVLRYEGPGTYTSGNPFFTEQGIQPATQTAGFGDKTSWGYRILARGTYNNAIGPLNLLPSFAWSHDFSGTTPSPVGNFIESRKTITAAVTATYIEAYALSFSYTNSFGGEPFNLRSDRDFYSLALAYSF